MLGVSRGHGAGQSRWHHTGRWWCWARAQLGGHESSCGTGRAAQHCRCCSAQGRLTATRTPALWPWASRQQRDSACLCCRAASWSYRGVRNQRLEEPFPSAGFCFHALKEGGNDHLCKELRGLWLTAVGNTRRCCRASERPWQAPAPPEASAAAGLGAGTASNITHSAQQGPALGWGLPPRAVGPGGGVRPPSCLLLSSSEGACLWGESLR